MLWPTTTTTTTYLPPKHKQTRWLLRYSGRQTHDYGHTTTVDHRRIMGRLTNSLVYGRQDGLMLSTIKLPPLKTMNKQCDILERNRYRMNSRTILVLLCVIVLILFFVTVKFNMTSQTNHERPSSLHNTLCAWRHNCRQNT